MTFTISIPDALRQSVESASGGQNTVLYDDKGYPSIMAVIPAFNLEDIDASLGTGLHPAFTVGGVTKSELLVGKYLADVHDNRAVSLPGRDPYTSINFDTAALRCTSKGSGWHLMTNAEWAAAALWSWKQGTMPSGNTNYGRDYANKHETGTRGDGTAPGTSSGTGRTNTGSGPDAWAHNGNAATGIVDLCGNVWEWVGGLRLDDGEIQILENNNAAAVGADLSATSTEWKAILEDGSLVAPGTASTLKWDASGALGTGAPILNTSITNQSTGSESASALYKDITADAAVTPPDIVKALALYPHATDMTRGRFYMRNEGERLPFRGGVWSGGSFAGVFALYLNGSRSVAGSIFGFRPAFVI